jgi:hypothetical protein
LQKQNSQLGLLLNGNYFFVNLFCLLSTAVILRSSMFKRKQITCCLYWFCGLLWFLTYLSPETEPNPYSSDLTMTPALHPWFEWSSSQSVAFAVVEPLKTWILRQCQVVHVGRHARLEENLAPIQCEDHDL